MIQVGRNIWRDADRVGGIDLILPWPHGLGRGAQLDKGEERDASPAEHATATAELAPLCSERSLLHTRTVVARLQRPQSVGRTGAVEDHLVCRLISVRYARTDTHKPAPERWLRLEPV